MEGGLSHARKDALVQGFTPTLQFLECNCKGVSFFRVFNRAKISIDVLHSEIDGSKNLCPAWQWGFIILLLVLLFLLLPLVLSVVLIHPVSSVNRARPTTQCRSVGYVCSRSRPLDQ